MKFTKKELKNLRKLSDSVKATTFSRSQKQIKDSVTSDIYREIKKAYPQVRVTMQSVDGNQIMFSFDNYPGQKERGYNDKIQHWEKFLQHIYGKYSKISKDRIPHRVNSTRMFVGKDSIRKDSKVKDDEMVKFPDYPSTGILQPLIVSDALEKIIKFMARGQFGPAEEMLRFVKANYARYVKEAERFAKFAKEYKTALDKAKKLIDKYDAELKKK